ncbi:sugar phosphate isomerase/epimerase family protein [Granulicella arctica]|nr:sugar phosphate isomerase/epimerase family protein [Granulicella arctica]
MERREFLGLAAGAALGHAAGVSGVAQSARPHTPMELGLLVKPYGAEEATIRKVKELGFRNCFFSLDKYLGGFTPEIATRMSDLLNKYEVRVTTVEVVNPQPLVWDFMRGPSTIGLVPRATRAARIDALRQVSDFGRLLGVDLVQTHCGFIPEDPADALYAETVEAIKTVARHCAGNGQGFLMETGQETPTTMSRMLRDAGEPNLGVGLDTANLILYGKANPVDAVDILGPHVKAMHAKDGKWPTDPSKLGEEVEIGKGLVNFREVLGRLHRVGYAGVVTIERETDGPQQIEDVKREKVYLEGILREVLG